MMARKFNTLLVPKRAAMRPVMMSGRILTKETAGEEGGNGEDEGKRILAVAPGSTVPPSSSLSSPPPQLATAASTSSTSSTGPSTGAANTSNASGVLTAEEQAVNDRLSRLSMGASRSSSNPSNSSNGGGGGGVGVAGVAVGAAVAGTTALGLGALNVGSAGSAATNAAVPTAASSLSSSTRHSNLYAPTSSPTPSSTASSSSSSSSSSSFAALRLPGQQQQQQQQQAVRVVAHPVHEDKYTPYSSVPSPPSSSASSSTSPSASLYSKHTLAYPADVTPDPYANAQQQQQQQQQQLQQKGGNGFASSSSSTRLLPPAALVPNLRPVHVPATLIHEFLRYADANTRQGVETCAVLAGKEIQGQFFVTDIVLPKQEGSPNTVITLKEEELVAWQLAHNLISLGWIHTHPTQTCFLSSIDMHCQFGYQIMVPEAIAIVCAPTHGQTGVFALSQLGMHVIGNCNSSQFHKHDPDTGLYNNTEHTYFHYPKGHPRYLAPTRDVGVPLDRVNVTDLRFT